MPLLQVKSLKMNTLFALVMTVYLTTGEVQDQVIGVYDSFSECKAVAVEQHITGECYPVEGIIRNNGETPAGL
jgi:hypothetical protein